MVLDHTAYSYKFGTVLKTIAAAMYTNYETSIVDDEGIEQEDAFLAGPVGRKLVLNFRSVSYPA
jgi:hypothetical protein